MINQPFQGPFSGQTRSYPPIFDLLVAGFLNNRLKRIGGVNQRIGENMLSSNSGWQQIKCQLIWHIRSCSGTVGPSGYGEKPPDNCSKKGAFDFGSQGCTSTPF